MNEPTRQQEFCANDVHDWKYATPTERTCKGCGVKHTYAPESEWTKAPPTQIICECKDNRIA